MGDTLTKDNLLEAIGNLTLVQAAELVKAMEEKFGISASAPVAVAATVPTAGGEESAEEEEKTEFDVVLKSYGQSKVQVIKVVREITGLALKEAKSLVEAGGKAIKEKISKEEADEIKKKIEAVGGEVEIK